MLLFSEHTLTDSEGFICLGMGVATPCRGAEKASLTERHLSKDIKEEKEQGIYCPEEELSGRGRKGAEILR